MLPPVLRLAGVDIRIATPDDHRRIGCDWFETLFPKFMKGEVQPFIWLARNISSLRTRGEKRILERIFHVEGMRWIHQQLKDYSAVVAFDVENPELILGWAHPQMIDQVYVVEAHRSFPELYEALRAACGP